MVTPRTSLGSMSEVNWRLWKLESTLRASACASVVLPTPGTSSISRCPRASRQASDRRSTSDLPRIASPSTSSISDSLESGTGGVYKDSRTILMISKPRCAPLFERRIEHFEPESLRRQRADRAGTHARPSLVGGAGDRGIQVEQELVREAFEWGRLAEGETHADRFFDIAAARCNRFVPEQRHEACAGRVGPYVGTQQIPQIDSMFKRGFALPDPLDDAVTPTPMHHETHVLIDQVQGQIHSAAFEFEGKLLGHGPGRNHIFLLDELARPAHHAIEPFHARRHVHQKRRQLMGGGAGHLDELAIAQNVHKHLHSCMFIGWRADKLDHSSKGRLARCRCYTLVSPRCSLAFSRLVMFRRSPWPFSSSWLCCFS